MENYDTGCTPGGGKDSMSVFYDAGLLFESNTASGTPYRQGDLFFTLTLVFLLSSKTKIVKSSLCLFPELKCLNPNRRKRAVDMMNVTTTLCKINKHLHDLLSYTSGFTNNSLCC